VNAATGSTIHLVNDDDAVRDSLKILLESYGMTVREHATAEEFLRHLDSLAPGCLVLDLHRPVLGGLDLLQVMRQRKIRLPVVYISARSDKTTRARALEAGASAVLDKPVPTESLMAAIRLVLKAESCAPSGKKPQTWGTVACHSCESGNPGQP